MQFSMKKISLLILLVAMCLSVLGCQLVIDRHEGDNTAPVDSVTEPAAPDTEYTPITSSSVLLIASRIASFAASRARLPPMMATFLP